MQHRAKSELVTQVEGKIFEGDRRQMLLDSLYAIARVDGEISEEENIEIREIAAEFGLDTTPASRSLA
jgi:tellurite resistance protein